MQHKAHDQVRCIDGRLMLRSSLTGIAEDVVAVLSVARVQQDAPGLAASAAMDLMPADGDLHAGCLDDAPQNVEPGDGTSG